MSGKVKNLSQLKKIICRLKKDGRKIVFTNGCFDILHKGHIELLEKAKSLGDILVVGLNSDGSVKRIKDKSRPINTAKDRAFVLAKINDVDYITIFAESTPFKLIKHLKPDILVKGADWKKEKIVGRNIVEGGGGKVASVPLAKGYSTTNIIKKIIERCG
ncbi:MAG: D-glycero-beta-D-manno-heptose 1-phosphate adenylyltransferase [Candidatus Omnitrophica bacterium]|nr:D-glycero-beta-D-manno-heptose 1-phosphate adenylyltransferase [Candidatus Omnitrophota bacterium]